MLTLSELSRWRVTGEQWHKARIFDFIVTMAGKYPVIESVLVRAKRAVYRIPWSTISEVDADHGVLKVTDSALLRVVNPRAEFVLLKREICDALMLDIAQRRAVTANTVLLELRDGKLWLRAIDISPWVVLERFTAGRLQAGEQRRDLVDWQHLVFLQGNPQAAECDTIDCRELGNLTPADIAHLSEFLPYLHAAELLMLLPEAEAADTLEAMFLERQVQVFAELSTQRQHALLQRLAPDAAVQLLTQFTPDVATALIEQLPHVQRQRVVDLLRYPANTAASIMTNDMFVVPITATIGEARTALREHIHEPDFALFVYIVDSLETQQLRGVLSLRDLVAASDDQPLAACVRSNVLALQPLEPAKTAAYRVIDSHLAALPVLGNNRRLLGILTVDAAISEVLSPQMRAQLPRIFS